MTPGLRSRISRLRSERGVALVEFVLVFPILCMVALGTVDFGRVYIASNEVKNAAREGAAYAQLQPGQLASGGTCSDPNTATWHALNEAGNSAAYTVTFLKADGTTITATCNSVTPPVASGGDLTVRVRRTFPLVTPLVKNMLGGDPVITSSVTVRVQ